MQKNRKRAIIANKNAIYSISCKTICGFSLFNAEEKDYFSDLMWKQAEFCGLEIITFCILNEHFHILIRVPYEREISDETLLKRYAILYSENVPLSSFSYAQLKNILERGGEDARIAKEKLIKRMGDIRVFMRELKQRFGIWYNKKHQNQGTLWSNRYKNTIIEDKKEVLIAIAAYIDLNPIRLGITDNPKNYPFCGYSQAMLGNIDAQYGLASIGDYKFEKILLEYESYLYGDKTNIQWEKGKNTLLEELNSKTAPVSAADLLRYKIRYFSDSLMIGSEEFIENFFDENRKHFGRNRKTGAHKLPTNLGFNFSVLRNLQRNVIEE